MNLPAFLTTNCCVVACLCGQIARADDRAPEHEPVLESVVAQIEDVLKREKIEPKISWDAHSVTISTDTRRFQVHQSLMNGDFTEKTFEQLGPQRRGFILTVTHRDDDPAQEQFAVPQTLREPYWQTYLNWIGVELPITGSKPKAQSYYWVSLSYGSRLDAKLLDLLRNTTEKTIAKQLAKGRR